MKNASQIQHHTKFSLAEYLNTKLNAVHMRGDVTVKLTVLVDNTSLLIMIPLTRHPVSLKFMSSFPYISFSLIQSCNIPVSN